MYSTSQLAIPFLRYSNANSPSQSVYSEEVSIQDEESLKGLRADSREAFAHSPKCHNSGCSPVKPGV